ncbi:hypothetical protein V1282_001396 [Nitrobacteraceae bacterium AZCC 2146]
MIKYRSRVRSCVAQIGRKSLFLGSSILAIVLASMFSSSAKADDVADRELRAQIQGLQEQNRQIQARLDALSRRQAALAQSPVAKAAVPLMKPGTTLVTSPGKGQMTIGSTTITLGGFVEGAGVYRSPAVQSDLSSAFTKLPFVGGSTSPTIQNGALNAREQDVRASARGTRMSVGVSSEGIEDTILRAFVEGDFVGTGTTSSQVSSNSYVPRLRQAWVGYERPNVGWHVFAGQQFSLITPLSSGLSPGKEKVAPVIDLSQTVGTAGNIRQASLRIVKDFDNRFFFALSVENAQLTSIGTVPATAAASFTANSVLGTSTSSDVAPDIVAKAASDTSFGHYELFGVARFLHDRMNVAATSVGQGHTKFAGGGGAAASLPIIPKLLDLQGSVIYGNGTARYSAAYLGDVAFRANGDFVPLKSTVAQIGLVGHATPRLDIYGFAGYESISGATGTFANDFSTGTSNAACVVTNGATCNAIVKAVGELTVGAWYSLYQGEAGLVRTGFQYMHLSNETFKDAAGFAPKAKQDAVLLSMRYFPFN